MRWWENYFVRYLVGSVIGAIMIVILTKDASLPFKEVSDFLAIEKSEFLGVSMVGIAGFAFCYVASSPILTVHALRAHLRLSAFKRSRPLNLLVWLAAAASVAAVTYHSEPPKMAWAVYATIVAVQGGLVVTAAATRFKEVESFYRMLSSRRGAALNHAPESTSAGSEYITSYRHLREHGNAVLIVLMQFALAFVLASVCTYTTAALVVAGWLAPAGLTWIVGTILEGRMVSRKIQD